MLIKRNVNFDNRQLVIFHYEKGNSNGKIAEMLCFSKSTVSNIVQESAPKHKVFLENHSNKVIKNHMDIMGELHGKP